MTYATSNPHESTSFTNRGMLPVPAAAVYCEPCRAKGHHCLASNVMEGETPKCIFCEDGEPCPHARKPSPLQKPAILIKDVVETRATREEPVRVVAQPRPRRALGTDNQQLNPTPPTLQETTMEDKYCSVCSKKLKSNNKSGRCTEHQYIPKSQQNGSEHAGGRMPKTSRKPAAKTPPPSSDNTERTVASLLVSEQQLISMFTAWPLEDKVSCIQAWLDQAGR